MSEISLGIDTGGTYTDAALIEHRTGRVLFTAKSLTTYDDLSKGISRVVDAVFSREGAPSPDKVGLVGLSTTLATNAIVEGRGGRVCLILIGYDPELISSYGLERELVVSDVVHLRGGHDGLGNEARPLDLEGALEAARIRQGRIDAFAVSAYFGVRNPAHELAVREALEQETGLPVTCGHELTTRLDSIRRATTVALNASLVGRVKGLIETVREVLEERRIPGRLMVVKGDGSLVRADWATRRPIETILSGPAASVVGAWHLTRDETGSEDRDDSLWVMDIGGTTTDIAFLERGRPKLSREGASVGRWRTMVEAVDLRTVGLGGDSRVKVDKEGRLTLGPRRVIPISQLAAEHPGIIPELKRQARGRNALEKAGIFFKAESLPVRSLSPWEQDLWGRLQRGPASWEALIEESSAALFLTPSIRDAASERIIGLAGFTPTDALHVLGRMDVWDAEAALLGAKILAKPLRLSPEEFCRRVVREVIRRAAQELALAGLSGEGVDPGPVDQPLAEALFNKALTAPEEPGRVSCALTLNQPLVAIGAPVGAYGPPVADRLTTDLTLPRHAEVANAVGAVVGGVIIRRQVRIKPLVEHERLRVHLPDTILDLDYDIEAAVSLAREETTAWLAERSQDVGAIRTDITVDREDRLVAFDGRDDEPLYLGTELTFTAIGRPAQAD